MTTTVAQAHRQLVAEMDEAGDSPAEIARKLGIPVDRVEAILDQLDESDGRPPHPDDDHRAPAVEPVRPDPRPAAAAAPIVVGSPARAPKTKPTVDLRPVPDIADEDPSTHRPTWMGPEDAPPPSVLADPPTDPPAAPKKIVRSGVRENGTAKGARQHWSHKEPVCDPCRQAYNAENRKSPEPSKRTGPAPCGTQQAYKRHLRNDEKPCGPCQQAHSEYMEQYRNKPVFDRPEGAVAHLSLPLAGPALIAVVDALELAYGPGIRVDAADGGVWVLGRAS